jgi:hypothetical protein
MICEGVDQPFCLDAYRMARNRGAMGGYKQGHVVIWADDAKDEWGSPDARRETSGTQVGITKYP